MNMVERNFFRQEEDVHPSYWVVQNPMRYICVYKKLFILVIFLKTLTRKNNETKKEYEAENCKLKRRYP